MRAYNIVHEKDIILYQEYLEVSLDHFLEIARFVESQGGEPTDELLAEIEKAELAIDCFHELGGEPKYLKSCILKKRDKGLRVKFEESEQPKKKQEEDKKVDVIEAGYGEKKNEWYNFKLEVQKWHEEKKIAEEKAKKEQELRD